MDAVVTIPWKLWTEWLSEGDLAAEGRFSPSEPEPWGGRNEYGLIVGHVPKNCKPGDRIYIVAMGYVRGYAPLVRVDRWPQSRRFGAERPSQNALVRRGDAVACTLAGDNGQPRRVKGFQGVRYRWWERNEEIGFPDWKTRR